MKRNRLIILTLALALSVGIGIAWRKTRPHEPPSIDELLNYEFDPKLKTLSKEVRQILESPDSFRLYSLDPGYADLMPVMPTGDGSTNFVSKEIFHEHVVLGSVEIVDKQQRVELVTALSKGMSEAKGMSPACFNPRHGISVVKNGEKVELLICFECRSLNVFAKTTEFKRTSYSPAKVFNNALKRADLPLAPE